MSTAATEQAATELVERFTLKALVESCLVLEEGIATIREIDLGMMAGAGIIPRRSRGPTSSGWTTCFRGWSGPHTSGARPSSRR